MTAPVGTLCIVLHSHLPWLPHHGTWPVGEEWLHQAWAGSYLPLVEVLTELAAEGRRDLLSLGVTPVLAAALDDPYALREHHGWLGRWRLRAEELAADRDPALRRTATEDRMHGDLVAAHVAAGDDPPTALRARVEAVSAADFVVTDEVTGQDLDGCLDLLLVAVRR